VTCASLQRRPSPDERGSPADDGARVARAGAVHSRRFDIRALLAWPLLFPRARWERSLPAGRGGNGTPVEAGWMPPGGTTGVKFEEAAPVVRLSFVRLDTRSAR